MQQVQLEASKLEEARHHVDAKYSRLRHMNAELRAKDLDLARAAEDKMRILGTIMAIMGAPQPAQLTERDYLSLVRERGEEAGGGGCTKEELLALLKEATRLAECAYAPSAYNLLARSVSSVGERQSADYAMPNLPQRADTFGGFDQGLATKQINVDEPAKGINT